MALASACISSARFLEDTERERDEGRITASPPAAPPRLTEDGRASTIAARGAHDRTLLGHAAGGEEDEGMLRTMGIDETNVHGKQNSGYL